MNTKLEIGPGKSPVAADWDTLNVVVTPTCRPTYLHDIACLPYPIPAGRYSQIYASHVLEHAAWHQSVAILQEWRRILAHGGRLDVAVPDFGKIVAAYHDRTLPARKNAWWRNNPEQDPMLWINGRIFTYGPEPNWHRAVFDEEHLRNCLRKAGFRTIHRSNDGPARTKHGWINLELTARK